MLLEKRVERIIKVYYYSQHTRHFKTSRFVAELKEVYLQTKRANRGDVLVPFSEKTIYDCPISKHEGEYRIDYKWNKGKDAEFVKGSISENACIYAGSYIDRFGSENGSYVSPSFLGKKPFSISERSLPYFFVESNIYREPSFHRYRVIRDISVESILRAVDEDNIVFENPIAKEKNKDDIEGFGIKYGKIAPVAAFLNQGKGLGLQYKLPLSVSALKDLQFIEDAMSWIVL